MRIVWTGWWYAGVVLVLGMIPAILVPPAGLPVLVLAGAVVWFFRDPTRTPPANGLIAPADGRVQALTQDGDRIRLEIFMNITDVHVNRSPVAGTIRDRHHRPGGYWPAFSKASDRNERVDLVIAAPAGEFTVSLIAGTVAQRITPYVGESDRVERGQRIGHIAFGSRVDVLFPPDIDRTDCRVAPGDRVTAGETVIAEWDETATGGTETH